jgi:rare lipoprotein A (peptidoglycan hydrolase)
MASGKTYKGFATFYNLPGRKTASGQAFDGNAMTGAMTAEKVPHLGTKVTVEYACVDKSGKQTTRSISVTVNDRGPFLRGLDGKPVTPLQPDLSKIIDLTPKAFQELVGSLSAGKAPVKVIVP